jgi:RNA polymerase sigma factor (sigma-70 family)
MLDILDSMAGIVSRELRSVREKVDVEDVLQEAAIAILKTYAEAPKKKAVWTAKSARRKAFRDQRRDHLWHMENNRNEFSCDPLAALIRSEEIDALSQAFEYLTEDQATAIKMRYYDDATLAEIAEVFGVSSPTAAKIVRDALEVLRERVG